MFIRTFWMAAAERATKTFLQFLVLIIGGNLSNVFDLDVTRVVGLSLCGLILSVITSVLSGLTGAPGPSLATEVVVARGRHAKLDPGDA